MKKYIFLILVATLFILVLFYFYDERINILNKEYHDYDNNIIVNYPFFNDIIIDNYLNDYLDNYINNDIVDLLFIDYDYLIQDDRIELIFYIYEEKGNIAKKESRKIKLDLVNSRIIDNTRIIDTSIDYDIYNHSIINYDKPMIALTFDDGPNHNTNRVLDILEKYNVKATFFILGSNIKGNEKTIKRMNQLGMEIGNHMYSHKLLTKMENKKILEEIKEVDNLIFNITNKYPTLIRPSYGTINKRIKSIMDKPIIIWNIDTLVWKHHNSKNIADKVLKKVTNGDIVLMHDIYRATANSLEIIIPKLLNEGYNLVTVSELLYYKGIDTKPGKVYINAN